MIFSTASFFVSFLSAPFFGSVDVPNAVAFLLIAAPFLYFALLYSSSRLVFDVFRDASSAQSPRRLVPWSGGTAFCVFFFGVFLCPIFAVNAISSLPSNWLPNFSSVQLASETAENANNPNGVQNPNENLPSVDGDDENELATQHPLSRLLVRSRSTPWALETLLLCFFVAVIAAPFAEEFFFRVLFQGTLENVALREVLAASNETETPRADFEGANARLEPSRLASGEIEKAENGDLRPQNAETENVRLAPAPPPKAAEFRWTDPTSPTLRRAFYLRSAFAILAPAFIFALIHAGAPETPEEARDPATLDRLFRSILASGIANVAALALAFFILLRRSSGASLRDVGFGPEFTLAAGGRRASLRRFALDFYRGVGAFAFIAPLIFSANAALRLLFPNAIVDPFPLFFFALAEGVVYWRLRRYATVVGMHVALNATSFVLLCLSF